MSFVFVDVAERPVVDNVSNVQPADFFECPLLAESSRSLTVNMHGAAYDQVWPKATVRMLEDEDEDED